MSRDDERWMRKALELARRARRVAPPNPWVGAVVVRDGTIVGEGSTRAPGGPHAEVLALRQAGAAARGATLYVTLEPCDHQGRTPPCVDTVLDAGIARVVAAIDDPDVQVAGRGLARLRAAGVGVDLGSGPVADEVTRELAPYLHHRRTGRAWCLCKTAMSLDGRGAARDGTSQWITGAEARADAHRLRAESQAVVVGAGTALADRPALTAREVDPPAERQPLRVLLDAAGRVPIDGPLFDVELASTLVVTTAAAPAAAVDGWRAAGAKVEELRPAADGRGVDLLATLELLGGLGVVQAMVEGGGRLHGALLDAGLVDRIVAYVAPLLLGDGGRPALALAGPNTLAGAGRWKVADATRLGADLRLVLEAPGEG